MPLQVAAASHPNDEGSGFYDEATPSRYLPRGIELTAAYDRGFLGVLFGVCLAMDGYKNRIRSVRMAPDPHISRHLRVHVVYQTCT